jgi:hypothetical protein
MRLFLYLLVTLFSGQAVASYCYQLTRGDELIYQGSTPPFDISYDLHRGMSEDVRRSQARGELLVFFSGPCARGRSEGRFGYGDASRDAIATSTTAGSLQLDRMQR